MSLMQDFERGHKDYYDEVPRYKNPWSGGHLNDGNAAYWDKGWEVAKEEHHLFTENQELKTHISELSLANIDEILSLKEEKSTFEETINRLGGIISKDSQTIVDYRSFINKRDDQLNALMDTVGKMNKFTFSREKIVSMIKKIFDIIFPEVEKRKTK